MLRPRHVAFARRRVIHFDEPASASYRIVGYDAAAGNSAHACASRLLHSAKVAERIRELQEAAARRHATKVDTITEQLQECYAQAMASHQHSAAVAACMGLAKLHGLIIKKSEHRATSGFERCSTLSDVVDVMVRDLGGEEAALQCLDRMRG